MSTCIDDPLTRRGLLPLLIKLSVNRNTKESVPFYFDFRLLSELFQAGCSNGFQLSILSVSGRFLNFS